MTRYFAYATAIVVAAVLVILALGRWTSPLPSRYTSRSAPAASPRREATGSGKAAAAVAGAAPWALSALPDCFEPRGSIGGSAAYVRTHLAALAPGTWRRVARVRLRSADCDLTIADRSALVVRGSTRLIVPPDARFFVAGNRLILDRVADGRTVVRVYVLRDGRTPAFAPL